MAAGLRVGVPARAVGLSDQARLAIKSMGLLTLKPLMYAFNVDEADLTLGRQAALEAAEATLRSSTRAERQAAGAASDLPGVISDLPAEISDLPGEIEPFALVSAQLESDLAELGDAERAEYLEGLGMGAAACALSHTLLPTMVLSLLGTTPTLTQTLSPLTLTLTQPER